MRTLKPFIRTAPGLLLAFLVALFLSACTSLDGGAGSNSPSEAGQPALTAETGSDSESRVAAADAPVIPTPAVKGDNGTEFEAAVAFIQKGRYRDAEILLLGITSDQPELAGPWINLGQVYVALEQPDEARRAFEAAVRANPWNCTAHNELGLLSRVNGDFAAAETHYLSCIERMPGNGPANLNLGILYELYLGRLTDALVYYRHYQSLQNEPDRRVRGWVMDLERRLGV